MLFSVATSVLLHGLDLDVLVMEQIVTKMPLGQSVSPDQVAGFILSSAAIGAELGNIIRRKLIGRCKKTIYILAFLHYLRCSCVIFLLGVCSRSCVVCLIKSLLQHTYPKDVIFVRAWIHFN